MSGTFFYVIWIMLAPTGLGTLHRSAIAESATPLVLRSVVLLESTHLAFTYKLDAAKPGEKISAIVELENLSSSAITLKSAEASCDCVKVSFQPQKLQTADLARLAVTLTVDAKPKLNTQAFDLTLIATGGCERIALRFSVPLRDVAHFTSPEQLFTAASNEAVSFRVPLAVSDEIELEKLKVKLLGNLDQLRSKIVVDDRGPCVILSKSASESLEEDLAGEIVLLRESKAVDTTLCSVTRIPEAAIHPSRCVLTVDSETPASRRGTLILKRRVPTSVGELRSVSCTISEFDGTIEVRSVKISSDTYRFNLTIRNAEGLPKLGKLQWVLSPGEKGDIRLTSQYVLSN